MSTTTTHYSLTKWSESDAVNVAEINANTEKVDQALDALATNIESKCCIATGTYSGTGTYGADNPTTLTLPFQPKVLFIDCSSTQYGQAHLFLYGMPHGHSRIGDINNYYITMTWNGTSVSWYSTDHAIYQFNESGVTYTYVAIA